jgi:F-type H+-transporting ATPase subunit a
MVFRILKQLNHNLAHLVPEGTPRALIPLIVLIETVSLFVRPLALTVRLAANMVAGHLLLTLLGRRGGGNLTIVIGVVAAISLLATLECAVACIQAYVFTILRSLYLNDHTSLKLIKQ